MRNKVKLNALFGLVLSGCGAGPARQPPPQPPSVQHQAGGALISGCRQGDLQVLAFAAHAELWRMAIDAPPTLEGRLPLGEPTGPVVDHLDCAAGITIGRGAQRWRLDPQVKQLIAAGEGLARLPSLPIEITLAGELKIELNPGRIALTGTTGDRWWRALSGPLRAAIWDGQAVWAVGLNGLWRWRPGPGQPAAIPLPDGWRNRPLGGIFQDAQFMWLTDLKNVGAAFDVRAPIPTQKGEAGSIPPAGLERRLAAGGHLYEGTLGDGTLRVDGEFVVLDAPLDALTEFRDGALIAAGKTLAFWGGDNGREIWQILLPGRTAAVFGLTDGRVILVGQRYGFMALQAR